MVGGVATVPQRGALVLGMILEDVLAEQGLAVTRDGVHVMQHDALADDRKRVTGEVGVGHRVDEQVGLGVLILADEVRKQRGACGGQVELVLAQAGDRLVDELLGVADGVQVLLHGSKHVLATKARFLQPLLGVLLASTRLGVKRLGAELLEVQNLNALLTKNLGKAIVLLLRNLEEGDVVEEQAPQIVRSQVEELLTRTMEQDLLQGADFAVDIKSVHDALHSFRATTVTHEPIETNQAEMPRLQSPTSFGNVPLIETICNEYWKLHLQYSIRRER